MRHLSLSHGKFEAISLASAIQSLSSVTENVPAGMASSRLGESRPNGNFHHNDASPDLDEDYELLMQYPDQVDYYSLLGLSRNPLPTDSQLQTAYHNLSLSLHPDKQPAHLVESANAQFRRVQEAYMILSDPKKRIVYDLEGEEGVQREWSAGGPMAARMESEDAGLGQVGPRAMSPAEFRKWFIARMKAKERTALNRLVGAKASMSITIDASSLISPGEEEGEVVLNFPPPKLRTSRFVLGYSLKTALPDFTSAWTWVSGRRTNTEEETPQENGKSEEQPESSPEVTLHASVSGAIRQSKQAFRVPTLDGGTEVIKMDGSPFLGAATFNLGATVNHQITTAGLHTSPQSTFDVRSLLEGASVGGTMTILPARALALHIEKQIYPFPNSKPFTLLVKSTIPNNVNNFMPNITTSIVRQFGSRKFGTLAYSTGSQLTWPSFMREILSPFMKMSLDPRLEPMLVNDGSLQLQYTSLSGPTAEEVANDPDLAKSTENEVWQWGLAATPAGGQLSLTYGRTFFADRLEDIPRSEWNLDGYHPTIPLPERRGVRVEVEAAVGLDGDMAWGVTASRRVSDFTSMGFGVSLRDARGLVLALSWRRLGQSIRVPIMICPLDLADAEISALAVIVPWLTYIGVEFGFIRPQERRRRRETIIRKRKQLKSQLSARKKESAQQIELMSDLTKRRQAREKDKGGLVIEKAEYGYIPPKNAKRTEPEVIDVTIPVAAQVDKSQLFISKNTIRFQIIGFYDPAPLLPKTLKVWYTFRGQRHYAEARDGEDLACPRREHMLIPEDL